MHFPPSHSLANESENWRPRGARRTLPPTCSVSRAVDQVVRPGEGPQVSPCAIVGVKIIAKRALRPVVSQTGTRARDATKIGPLRARGKYGRTDVNENGTWPPGRLALCALGAVSFLAAGAGVVRSSLVLNAIALDWRPALNVLLIAFPIAGWVVADRIGQLCHIIPASRPAVLLRKAALTTALVLLGGMGLLIRPAQEIRDALVEVSEQPLSLGIATAAPSHTPHIERAVEKREPQNPLQFPPPLNERALPESVADSRVGHAAPPNGSTPSTHEAVVPGSPLGSLTDPKGSTAKLPSTAASCNVVGNGKIVKWVDTFGVTHYSAGERCPSDIGSDASPSARIGDSCTVVGGGRLLKWVDRKGVTRYLEGSRCPEPAN